MDRPTRLARLLAGAALLLGAALPATAHGAQPGVTPLGNLYDGAHQVDEFSAVTGALAKAPAEGKWTRLFVDWAQLERARGTVDSHELGLLRERVARFDRAGLKVALVVSTKPGWAAAPQTAEGAAQYADFMGRLAGAVGGVDVWELWNEPNVNGFDAAQYAQLLRAAFPAVKAAAPSALVIVGGLAGNDYNYVEGLYANGAGTAFDGIGLHTDTACLTDGPDAVPYREAGTGRIGFTAFTGYREVRRVMLDNGDGGKGIYLTEIGWAVTKGKGYSLKCNQGAKQGKKAGGVTEKQQTAFLAQAYACLAADPYVVMASWFTDQDFTSPRRHVAGYGLYDHGGRPRPILGALQGVGDGTDAGVDRSCGGGVDRDAPTVTIAAGPSWFHRLVVSGDATDAASGVRKIELWGDGRKIMTQRAAELRKRDGRFRYDWFGSSRLGYGKHVVELRAYDKVGNVGRAGAVVERVDPATAPRLYQPRLRYAVERSGRTFRVRARVGTPADGSFREVPRGKLELRFERRDGKRWKRSRIRAGIGSGRVSKRYTAYAGGRWRAYAVLELDAPYKRATVTPKATFRVR